MTGDRACEVRAGNRADSTPSSATSASARRRPLASDSASPTLRCSEASVWVWAATVPVGTWCSSTRTHGRRNMRAAATAYKAMGRDVRASSAVEGTRLVL